MNAIGNDTRVIETVTEGDAAKFCLSCRFMELESHRIR